MRFYILVFDRLPMSNVKAFHEAFVRHPGIRTWWHYVKSCYIIGTSTLSSRAISDHYHSIAPKYGMPTRHLVVKVDLKARSGWLPKEAWEWITKRAAEQL